jgi:alpha-tubulin suppressor-like RCC1 family protein
MTRSSLGATVCNGRLRAFALSALLLACSLTSVACGGSDSTAPRGSHLPATVRAIAGTGQSAAAGSSLPIAPAVVVKDSAGREVGNVRVTFTVTAGGGHLEGATQTTGDDGVATVGGWTLGDSAGANVVTATVAGLPSATFNATGMAGSAAAIAVESGDNQTGVVGSSIYGITLVVEDAHGNPVGRDVPVTFEVTSGGGRLEVLTPRTDTKGKVALGSWELGPEAGVNTFTASLTNLPSATVAVTATAVGFRFKAIAAGGDHTCGIAATGAAYCWGANEVGQLGDGTTTDRAKPVAVSGGYSFKKLAAGARHTCGIQTGSAMVCWGGNDSGQVGNGSISASVAPTVVAPERTFRTLVAGSAHTCAVTSGSSGGEVLCWGSNSDGQISDASIALSATPVRIGTVDDALQVSEPIAASNATTCILMDAAERYPRCMGRIHFANGTTSSFMVVGNFQNVSYYLVAGGGEHFCGIDSDYYLAGKRGAVRCWGLGIGGVIGDGSEVTYDMPGVQVVNSTGKSDLEGALALGPTHTCAAHPNLATLCWGSNESGQLGDGTTTDRLTPTPVMGGTFMPDDLEIPFSLIAAGSRHTCGIALSGLDDAGPAYCWGDNSSGQLGDGTTTPRSRPSLVSAP